VPPTGPLASPTQISSPDTDLDAETDLPWIVLVWNDPVNTMDYVTLVFQKLFSYSKAKAHSLMMDVHVKGRAVVSSGTREKAEIDVFRLHEHGLWATMQHDE
jgi:ATP-dependent Clp protease adaptor protein ClpS